MAQTMTVKEAYALVWEGRSHQRENFPVGHPGKYVGKIPSEKYDEALDVLLALLPSLIEAWEMGCCSNPPESGSDLHQYDGTGGAE